MGAADAADYSDFIDWLENHSGLHSAWDFGGDFSEWATELGVPGGWKESVLANGHHNFRHYASAHVAGFVAAAAQFAVDISEYGNSGDPQRLAEVHADLAGGASAYELGERLAEADDSFFVANAYSDAAWARVRHLPGALWRKWFCEGRK